MELAIKGHKTRGAEVIALLEMLGGKNTHNYSADSEGLCFYLGKGTNTIYYDWVNACYEDEDTLVFSLEEFEEKYPYKVGDKVQHKGSTSCGSVFEVEKMRWVGGTIEHTIKRLWYNNCRVTASVENLQPYKEETMETMENNIIDTVKESEGRYRIVLNHQFDMEVDEGEYYAVRRKPQYPKTYKECCEVLMGKTDFQDFELVLTKLSINQAQSGINIFSPVPPHITLINNFYKLLICRDAYWKIAGEEMSLGKPWKPDWNNGDQERYGIIKLDDNGYQYAESTSFVFPTAEMRDVFLENFKELIEICKELL